VLLDQAARSTNRHSTTPTYQISRCHRCLTLDQPCISTTYWRDGTPFPFALISQTGEVSEDFADDKMQPSLFLPASDHSLSDSVSRRTSHESPFLPGADVQRHRHTPPYVDRDPSVSAQMYDESADDRGAIDTTPPSGLFEWMQEQSIPLGLDEAIRWKCEWKRIALAMRSMVRDGERYGWIERSDLRPFITIHNSGAELPPQSHFDTSITLDYPRLREEVGSSTLRAIKAGAKHYRRAIQAATALDGRLPMQAPLYRPRAERSPSVDNANHSESVSRYGLSRKRPRTDTSP